MMCRASLAAFAVLVVCALEVPRAASAAVTGTLRQSKDGEKRPIAETDLLKFTWIADPQVSPDGSTVVFVRVSVNERENRYETSLYAVSTRGPDQPRRLTSNIRDTSPRWAPDGN